MKYKAIIFDLDGTLLDTLEDIADSMNATLKEFGFPLHSILNYKLFIGDGIEELVRRSFPDNQRNDNLIKQGVQSVRLNYQKRWYNKTKLYDGIPQMLDEIRDMGFIIAVLSNKPHDFTIKCVQKFLLKWKFDLVYGALPEYPHKPDPTLAKKITDEMKLNPNQVIYVGDTSIDMKTAKAAKMIALGVLWGFRDIHELKSNGADIIIQHPLELIKKLKDYIDRYDLTK
ncbi:hypothetical protein BVX93_00290 [bacterium B13(2017)]|nr:hypothetical protein BVX93_00290 [bacterium B13(2017)]